MNINHLYYFIDQHLSDEQKFTQGYQYAVSQRGQRYYRLSIPVSTTLHYLDNDSLKCIEQHISVYQVEDKNDPNLSSYHYTGHFVNKHGQPYRIHVYFNQNDQAIKTDFSLLTSEETYEALPHSKELVIALAQSQMGQKIFSIKNQLCEHILILEAQYQKIDLKASNLSKNWQANPDEYIQTIKEARKVLLTLDKLVKHNHYAMAALFLHRLQQNLKEEHAHFVKEAKQEPVNIEATSSSVDAIIETSAYSPTLFPSRKTIRKSNISLDKPINELCAQFEKLKLEPLDVQLDKWEYFLREKNSLSLLLEGRDHSVTSTALAQLKAMHDELMQQGKNNFTRSILLKQFDKCAQMPSFYYLLDNKLYQLALLQGNAPLLDFILSHSNIVNYIEPVSIAGKEYICAVEYCFKENTPDKPLVDCLSVLIRHGASTMISDDEGMPLVHQVVSTPSHSLYQAFINNRNKTLDNPQFYQHLNGLLDYYVSISDMPSEKREGILQAIDYYKTQKSIQKGMQAFSTTRHGHDTVKLISDIEINYADIVLKIRKDPEVSPLIQKLNHNITIMIKGLPRQKRAQIEKLCKIEFENLTSNIEKHPGSTADYEFEKLKALAIHHINNKLTHVEKLTTLFQLQDEISKIRTKPGRKNRHYNKMIQKQKTLMTELEELNKSDPLKKIASMSKAIKETGISIGNLDTEPDGLEELRGQLQSLQSALKSMHSLFSALCNKESFSAIGSSLDTVPTSADDGLDSLIHTPRWK